MPPAPPVGAPSFIATAISDKQTECKDRGFDERLTGYYMKTNLRSSHAGLPTIVQFYRANIITGKTISTSTSCGDEKEIKKAQLTEYFDSNPAQDFHLHLACCEESQKVTFNGYVASWYDELPIGAPTIPSNKKAAPFFDYVTHKSVMSPSQKDDMEKKAKELNRKLKTHWRASISVDGCKPNEKPKASFKVRHRKISSTNKVTYGKWWKLTPK